MEMELEMVPTWVDQEIQQLQNEDTLCGMFDEPEEDAAAAPDNNFPEV